MDQCLFLFVMLYIYDIVQLETKIFITFKMQTLQILQIYFTGHRKLLLLVNSHSSVKLVTKKNQFFEKILKFVFLLFNEIQRISIKHFD